jgi:hypothetical protein
MTTPKRMRSRRYACRLKHPRRIRAALDEVQVLATGIVGLERLRETGQRGAVGPVPASSMTIPTPKVR